MKSPAISPPINDPVPNQYINRLTNGQDPSLPPITAKYIPGYRSLFNGRHDPNGTEDYPNGSTYNSRNEKEDSVDKLKVTNNEYNDD